MDFIQIANQLQQSKNDLKENWCLINGFPYQLEQIEKMSLNELSGRSFENLPKKLYKFFPNICDGKCNYSIMALESNEVYLSTPSMFDDVFDSDISISFEEFYQYRIKSCLRWSNVVADETMSISEMEKAFLDKYNSVVKYDKQLDGLFLLDILEETERDQTVQFLLRLKIELLKCKPYDALRNAITADYNNFVEGIKNVFRVSCFTTNPMSQLMWGGSYADEHRGFCVEYSIINDNQYEDLLFNIKPVIYTMKRHPVTQELLESYDKNWNEASLRDVYINGVLRKSIDWAYQNEWRLVLPPQKTSQRGFTKLFFPISKVYLGNRMSSDRRKTIIDTCKKKGIPYVGVVRSSDYYEMQECRFLCEDCNLMGIHE